MKFVKGLSILGLAMASQGAWAVGGEASSDVYFSATATCAASIEVVGGSVSASGVPRGSSTNPIILNADIRDDRKLAVNGRAVLNVKSKCGYTIALEDMILTETYGGDNNVFTVEPSLAYRGEPGNDHNSTAILDESAFGAVVSSEAIATPQDELTGDQHDIYIRKIAAPTSADRGFSARPLTGSVHVTVEEL